MPTAARRPAAGNDTSAEMGGDDAAFLRSGRALPPPLRPRGALGFVDLFCGCGGLSLGVSEALRGGGIAAATAAIDNSAPAVAVYADNFGRDAVTCGDIGELMPADLETSPTDFERALAARLGPAGLLAGGPPCQGHSDLNNHTRRSDPRNGLYLHMARAAKVLRPDAVMIENVQGSPYDRSGSVARTVELLAGLGYRIAADLVDVSAVGVAQKRRRYIILATKREAPPIAALLKPYASAPRDLRWAIGDLEDDPGGSADRTAARASAANARRIDYLFERGLHDLPDSERPPCHRDRAHSYTSVYGRLHWDRPAPTITGGFYSMGMGRYVHPSRRRTLTPREAARIQFFPDFFRFEAAGGRTNMAKVIGNAVPPKLSWALTREMLRFGILRPRGR